jgi:hypothetical protein
MNRDTNRVAPTSADSREDSLPLGVFLCDRVTRTRRVASLPPRPGHFCRALRCLLDRRPPLLSERVHPPASFASPPECYGPPPAFRLRTSTALRPPVRRRKAPPGGFVPLRDINSTRPLTARRSQPRAMVRPRRFSRPRRFAPRHTLRVCFTPQPRPGFPFRGLSLPTEPHAVSRAVALLPIERIRLPV